MEEKLHSPLYRQSDKHTNRHRKKDVVNLKSKEKRRWGWEWWWWKWIFVKLIKDEKHNIFFSSKCKLENLDWNWS